MAQALITINSVTGSNTDLPINTLAQFSNINNGGETTYAWSILDQPPGTADAFSNPAIQNPTLTPKKEGTYLVKLVVNQGLSTEVSNIVVAAVRQLKNRLRVPGAGETTEADTSDGWAAHLNENLRRLDSFQASPGTVIGVAGAAGLVSGNVVKVTSVATIKSGLPGQEQLPSFVLAPATTNDNPFKTQLGILEGGVDGATNPASGALIVVRTRGRFGPLAGAFATGTPLFVSDTGTLATTPGTNPRQVGIVAFGDGVNYHVWVGEPDRSPAVSADRGDTSQTLTVGTDAPTQRWATALTANRTVTLSATGAVNGSKFRVARTGLGAFTLDVGPGVKTIPSATAAFVDVEYTGSAWVLTGYGVL